MIPYSPDMNTRFYAGPVCQNSVCDQGIRRQSIIVVAGKSCYIRAVKPLPGPYRPVRRKRRIAAPVKIGLNAAEARQLGNVYRVAESIRLPHYCGFSSEIFFGPFTGIEKVARDRFPVGHIQVPFNPGSGRVLPAPLADTPFNFRKDIRVFFPGNHICGHLTVGESHLRIVLHNAGN